MTAQPLSGPEAWVLADAAVELAQQVWALPWWRWRRRRLLLARATDLAARAAAAGIDVGPLFASGQISLRR